MLKWNGWLDRKKSLPIRSLKLGFDIVLSVVSVVSVVRKKIQDSYNFMETSRTNAQYKRNDRYNLLYEIE